MMELQLRHVTFAATEYPWFAGNGTSHGPDDRRSEVAENAQS